MGELDGVPQKVHQNLAEPRRGRPAIAGAPSDRGPGPLDSFAVRRKADHFEASSDHVVEVDGDGLEAHLSRLDLAEVEHVVDQIEEMVVAAEAICPACALGLVSGRPARNRSVIPVIVNSGVRIS